MTEKWLCPECDSWNEYKKRKSNPHPCKCFKCYKCEACDKLVDIPKAEVYTRAHRKYFAEWNLIDGKCDLPRCSSTDRLRIIVKENAKHVIKQGLYADNGISPTWYLFEKDGLKMEHGWNIIAWQLEQWVYVEFADKSEADEIETATRQSKVDPAWFNSK